MDHGADGVILSNHGGRQLDRAPIPFHLRPEVKEAFTKDNTDAAIMLDTGIMSGADIVAALALGADFTLNGRAYLYGLMAGGRAGACTAMVDFRATGDAGRHLKRASTPIIVGAPDSAQGLQSSRERHAAHEVDRSAAGSPLILRSSL